MIYHVDSACVFTGDGSQEHPFRTIQEAANAAMPGDEILVQPGVYREAVDPIRGGTEQQRITYRSAQFHKAVITGAEELKNWKPYWGDVWCARVPNSLFGGHNPYTTLVGGDWFEIDFIAHTGEVYLNDKSLYEVTSLQKVLEPEESLHAWDRAFSVYTWYTEQDDQRDETILYANFHGLNPNQERVEINVRPRCFFPSQEGMGHITLSGFTVTKAATQWAPPTAFQEGMIGPNWAKGWIIEDCEVSHSKCSGISLGKYLQPENDNKWLRWKYKDGTQTERECICQAQREGWSKERIGSHIIRRCDIHDCGQTGIVGHLGGVFSLIEDNHIHHINNKQNLAGAEIGGIKMHAAIDVIYRRNHIHHCTRGLWLDWQAQGTRVTQNLFHHNCLPIDEEQITVDTPGIGEDIWIEVSHGPTLLDNNIMLSERAIRMTAQGIALVHNLIAGSLVSVGIGTDNGARTLSSPRYTPYHVPHRTEIAGFMTFLHGDVRFLRNIFLQQPLRPAMRRHMEHLQGAGKNMWDDGNLFAGTWMYDNGYQTEEDWKQEFDGYCGMGSAPSDRYYIPLPVWAEENLYLNGAKPWCSERSAHVVIDRKIELSLTQEEESWMICSDLADVLSGCDADIIDSRCLGMAFEPEQPFEDPEGRPILFGMDYLGELRGSRTIPGPLARWSREQRVY